MKKKAKTRPSAIVRPSSDRPKGDERRTDSRGQGGFLTKHHPEDASANAGLDERLEVLKWRAMELKVQGLSLRQIALQITEDFELEKVPHYTTVDEWLDETFSQTATARQMNADAHCAIIMLRSEKIIRELLPIATGKVIIRRMKRLDRETVEVLDENAVSEMIAAAGELRKQHDQQAKLLKIGRVGETGGGDTSALTGHNLTILIEQVVGQQIIIPGQGGKVNMPTLVLASGDSDIDELDVLALDVKEHVPPI